jgi:hypothetical protein
MTFQSWKTVCPRCSEQNGSDLTPCSNCGKGPILYELYKYYQRRQQRFKCETCKVVYSNVNCLKCGTDISGTVRGGRSLGMLIKWGIIGFVLLMLLAWLGNSGDSGNHSQGYTPSSPNSVSPSSNSVSSRWQPGTDQYINGQEIARGTEVIFQIARTRPGPSLAAVVVVQPWRTPTSKATARQATLSLRRMTTAPWSIREHPGWTSVPSLKVGRPTRSPAGCSGPTPLLRAPYELA